MSSSTKPHITFFSLCMAVAIGMAACQVIPENEQLIPVESSESAKTCLLIDFSGWRCINCPAAAEEAHKLLEQYGDQLIVMEAHPATNSLTKPPAKYPEYDYTCPAADSLYIALGGTGTTPLPIGSVDMAAFNNGSGSGAYLKTPDQWGAMVYASLKNDCQVDIRLHRNEKKEIVCQLNNKSEQELACALYMWLTEDKNKKPFSDFDASSFDLFVGKVKDGHFEEGTYLSKKEEDYYVYHGKFDKDGKQTTDKGFLYSATYEQLMFGKFSKNAFVSGFVAIFDDDGNVKDLAKYDGRKTIGMEEINEEEKNKTCQIMTHFRNVILQKDYFGDAYNQYAKIKEFLGKEMKDIDIFNSDKYMDIFGITAAHNKIKIYEDITKLVKY